MQTILGFILFLEETYHNLGSKTRTRQQPVQKAPTKSSAPFFVVTVKCTGRLAIAEELHWSQIKHSTMSTQWLIFSITQIYILLVQNNRQGRGKKEVLNKLMASVSNTDKNDFYWPFILSCDPASLWNVLQIWF